MFVTVGDEADIKFKVGDVIEVNSDSTDDALPLTHSVRWPADTLHNATLLTQVAHRSSR